VVRAKEILKTAVDMFSKAGLQSPVFDAMCLLEECVGRNARTQVISGGEIDERAAERFMELCRRRLSSPLQYVVGEWDFGGLPLLLGEGVLIAREDTLLLVDCAEEQLRAAGASANGAGASCEVGSPCEAKATCAVSSPRILDLCAGSGAVGLLLANRMKSAEVVCAELSEEAFFYLNQNIDRHGGGRVTALRADVLTPPAAEMGEGMYDAIVSNPPYIRSGDISSLQWEVQKEPVMALDGGEDGLVFYRSIAEQWTPLLKDGGLLAFEIGFDQARQVCEIMEKANFENIEVKTDLSGNDRVIYGTLNKKFRKI
jgi:release factor glutamine methyltransferase